MFLMTLRRLGESLTCAIKYFEKFLVSLEFFMEKLSVIWHLREIRVLSSQMEMMILCQQLIIYLDRRNILDFILGSLFQLKLTFFDIPLKESKKIYKYIREKSMNSFFCSKYTYFFLCVYVHIYISICE